MEVIKFIILKIIENIPRIAAMLIFACFSLTFLGNGIIWLTEFDLTFSLLIDSITFIIIGLVNGLIAFLLGVSIFN